MFGLRFLTDWSQRTKKGHPAHSTTGVLMAELDPALCRQSARENRWPAMARTVTTTVSGSVHQKRRRKSTSSGLSSSSSAGMTGSSAMPQIGQFREPAAGFPGCIGQV